jgi:hypothetical protein
MNSRDAERQELERALDILGRSTRHAKLLEYVGTKYFQHQEDQLTEFNIATEVFGRSPQRFVATQDAVVRVEAHRLRKKLRDIYDKDDRKHGLQISVPAGTYVPKFTPVPEPLADSGAGTERRLPKWAFYLSALALAGIAVVGIVISNRSHKVEQASPPTSAEQPGQNPGPKDGQVTELHLLAGNSRSEAIDNSGVRWTPDQFSRAGGSWNRDSGFVRRTSRQFLFSTWRTGEFGYDIPVAPGTYELRLFVVSGQRVGEERLAGFDVGLNGKQLLGAYDVVMSANGADVADEQVFRDVKPDKDGFVRLWFSNQTASPILNGLELTPGVPGKLKPIRILAQPTSFVDHNGQRWRADDYYLNGFQATQRRKVSGTDDPELFTAERFGHFSYAIPVDRRDRYTVVLHFAEFYFGPQLLGGEGVGRRVFHVFCNGQTLLRDFDIFKEAGSLRLLTKTFTNVVPTAQGKINLEFEPVINNATVSGIEVLDESDYLSQ